MLMVCLVLKNDLEGFLERLICTMAHVHSTLRYYFFLKKLQVKNM